MKRLLFLALAATIHCASSQIIVKHIPDAIALTGVLAYFGKNGQEQEVREAAQQVHQLLLAGKVPDDSLATHLLNLESLLATHLKEYVVMNYRPYQREQLFTLFEKTATLLQRLPPENENLHYASALYNLVAAIQYIGPAQKHRYDIGSLLETSFFIREKRLNPDHPDYLEGLLGLARACTIKGDNEKATMFLQQVLNRSASGDAGAKRNYADALFELATIYVQQYQYDKATLLFEQENGVRQEVLGPENPSYALRLYVTGDMLLYTGEYRKAFSYFSRALDLTKKNLGEGSLQYAYCLTGAGSVFYHTGDYKQAVSFYKQALAIKENLFGKDGYDIPLALHQLATTYVRMGLYEQALPLFERACAIALRESEEQGIDPAGAGYFISHFAAVYQAMHQHAPAYTLLRKAVSLTAASAENDGWLHGTCLQNLSLLFEDMGRYDSALFYLQKAVILRKKKWGEEHSQYATTLHLLSGFYAKMARPDTALLLCRQAAAIREKRLGKEHADYAASLHHLGELYLLIGSLDSAQHYLQQALAIREKTLGPDHPDYVKSLNSLGRLALANGQSANAAALFTKANTLLLKHLMRTATALSEPERIILLHREADPFSHLPSLLYDNRWLLPHLLPQVFASELHLKGIILDDHQQVMNSIRGSRDSLSMSLYLSWRECRSALAKQHLLPPHQRLSFDSLQQKANHLEQQLTRRASFFRQQKQMQTSTTKDISSKLREGEAAIEFIRFRYYHHRWTDSVLYAAIVVLPGDTTGRFIPLFEERQLQSALQNSEKGFSWVIKRLYPGQKRPRSGTAQNLLYRLIWKPLEECLKKVQTIWYAPAGLLHRVAFQALCNDKGTLLINKYRLSQVFSTRSLQLPEYTTARPFSVGIWGNIAYGKPAENRRGPLQPAEEAATGRDDWPLLSGTKAEAIGIKKAFAGAGIKAVIVRDTAATEERFKALDGNSPAVLHMATHGYFRSER